MSVIIDEHFVAKRLARHDETQRSKRTQSGDLAHDAVRCDVDLRECTLQVCADGACGQRDKGGRRCTKLEKGSPIEPFCGQRRYPIRLGLARAEVRRVVAGVDASRAIPIAKFAAARRAHGNDGDHRRASGNDDGGGGGCGNNHDVGSGAVVVAAIAAPIAGRLDKRCTGSSGCDLGQWRSDCGLARETGESPAADERRNGKQDVTHLTLRGFASSSSLEGQSKRRLGSIKKAFPQEAPRRLRVPPARPFRGIPVRN
jgi:hypothetical protein